jgi:hypothetical protein
VTSVYLEIGEKKVFACAVDWPGWCRAGRDEDQALEALKAYAPRYAPIAQAAGLTFPTSAVDFKVVERTKGSASTEFGVPGAIRDADAKPPNPTETERLVALVEAAWKAFDRVVAGAPQELRKGPRGGGRNRDKMVDHVLGAEAGYARQIGVRLEEASRSDTTVAAANRAVLIGALKTPTAGVKWPPRYAARRIAWHVLDHAWEIEDRSPT